ncbi:MAG: ABC transporter permease [bacterium]|nr:ABC transporter permease [bacterium]
MGKFLMILQIGFLQIFSHKLRSFLTMLGIILGVSSLISMFSIVQGSKEQNMKWMEERGGMNRITVRYVPLQQRPPGSRESKVQGLQYRDVEALKRDATLFTAITPETEQYLLAKQGINSRWLRVIGTEFTFLELNGYELGSGFFFSEDDYQKYSKVAVVGSKIEDEFFGGNALGREITINNDRYTIIGVLKEEVMLSRNKQENWMDWKNDIVLIPITTMQKRVKGNDVIDEIALKVIDLERLEETMEEIKAILILNRDDNEDFTLRSNSENMSEWQKMRDMWNFVLGAIASISLIVGGIGIMNTLLSNITERIREIGIRKAIGAKKHDILFQFLMESIVLSCLGGLLGVFIGVYFAGIIQSFAEIDTSISIYIVFLSFSFSVLVGILFGIMPSIRAARLDPIECLRYE